MDIDKRDKIIIAGGSGFLGVSLADRFPDAEIVVLSRSGAAKKCTGPNLRCVKWDAAGPGDWIQELEGSKAIINLAGKSVNSAFMIKIGAVFIKTEAEPVLSGRRVISTFLVQSGFKFKYPYLHDALKQLLTEVPRTNQL